MTRTPRKRALEIGTNPAGFEGDTPLDSAGLPVGHPSHGEYHDSACDIPGSKAPAVQPHGAPFKVGGEK